MHSCSVPKLESIVLLLLIVAVSGCDIGSDPNQAATYSCGDLSRGHCYAAASFGGRGCSDSDPNQQLCIHGYKTSIQVTDQLSPGDGFITHELWLSSFSSGGWIELGYLVAPQFGLRYFWAQNSTEGVFQRHELERVPPEDIGNLTSFAVVYQGNDTFRLVIRNDKRTILDTTTQNAMWRNEGYGYVNIGMELAGTTGGYSPPVVFQYNGRFDRQGSFHFETQDDPSPKVDAPPFLDWINLPSQGNEGGAFLSYCCTRPRP